MTKTRTLETLQSEFTKAEGLEFCDHADRVLKRHRIPRRYRFEALSFGAVQAIAVERDDNGFPVRALVWDGTTELGSPWRIVEITDADQAQFLGVSA